VFLALAPSCAKKSVAPDEAPLVSELRRQLTDRWECVVVQQDGQKGHPHGLDEPLFRVDFRNPHSSFPARWKRDEPKDLNPSIQLYFYDAAEKAHVMEVIHKERLYSWNIPIYFGETKDYVVVTSPPYVNQGVFTEKAKAAIRPLWEVLRKNIPNEEDQSVEGLVQSKE
jgi:hypothetical protein